LFCGMQSVVFSLEATPRPQITWATELELDRSLLQLKSWVHRACLYVQDLSAVVVKVENYSDS
jgi:hypothetical protein